MGGRKHRRRYVVLDRDGTVIEHVHHLRRLEDVRLIPGAAEGLRALQAAGYRLCVVTNQSVVGRGLLSHGDLDRIHDTLVEELAAEGVRVDGIFVCAHHPDAGCHCRKPQPALLRRAAQTLDFEPTEAWVIGDNDCDIEMAAAVGARGALVRTGRGTQVKPETEAQATVIAPSLRHAAAAITYGAPMASNVEEAAA